MHVCEVETSLAGFCMQRKCFTFPLKQNKISVQIFFAVSRFSSSWLDYLDICSRFNFSKVANLCFDRSSSSENFAEEKKFTSLKLRPRKFFFEETRKLAFYDKRGKTCPLHDPSQCSMLQNIGREKT